ncbi:MAG TPA: hypothetical protein VFA05_01370 [Gaiellaceae bacterium]|nr:hypothetical protein [Gaiellaceae bacterium]
MGIAVSLIITAAGLILALAVHPSHPGSVNVNTVGWILFVLGIVGLILDLLLWSSWGPGYLRRRTYVAGDPGYGYPARRWGPRRTVVEEEDAGPGAPPPGY